MSCSHSHEQETRASAVKERMGQVKHKVIVLSGKGGVGKSTVAVSLATSLALEGKQVGLLDVDLHGPTVPQLLGLNGSMPMVAEDQSLVPVPLGDNLKVMSIAFLLGEDDAAVVWRGPMKAVAIEQFLGEVEWGDLDYLVIDSPPGTGDEPLAVCQAIGDMDGAVIVTTPQKTALNNVRRSVKFCELLKLPVLGVIENMAGFVCPHCGAVTNVFSKGGGAEMAAQAGLPLLASLPLDPAIVEAADAGRSFIYHYSKTSAAQEFAKAMPAILALQDRDGAKPPATSPAAPQPAGPAAITHTVVLEKDLLRFAVPTTDGVLCPHFGHCDEFTLIDVDGTSKRVVGVTKITAPEHEPGLLPVWLSEKGATAIIAGGMGSRAQSLFSERGLAVLTGAPVGEPREIVEQYLAGSLATGTNVCDH